MSTCVSPSARSLSRSLFAQRQAIKRAVQSADANPLDTEAVYTVEQCVEGNYTREPQCVSYAFIQSLRDAAFALDVDYEQFVAPYFYSLDPYERCVYTWRGAGGGWCMLSFDGNRAFLAVVGAPRIDKLVGAFTYSICPERGAIRLVDVGPYAEVMLVPQDNSANLAFTIPELQLSIVLVNQTPQRLRNEA